MQTEAQNTSTPILKKTRVNTPDTLEEETDKETMVSLNQEHLICILKVSYNFFLRLFFNGKISRVSWLYILV